MAPKTPSGEGREKVLAKIPSRTSDSTFDVGEPHGLAGLRRAGHRRHPAHRRKPVFGSSPAHRGAVEYRFGQPLDLPPAEVAVRAQGPVVTTVLLREALHVAGLQVPGVIRLPDHAAVLAVDLEALVPVHADLYRQVEVSRAPVGELDLREPAIRAELFNQSGADGLNLPAQKAGRVEQVARMSEHVVAPEIRLRVALRPPRPLAQLDYGLKGVGHGVAMGRVAVPGLQRKYLAHLLADKPAGEGDSLVEAPLGADLHDEPGYPGGVAQFLALLEGDAHRLLHQDVLACLEGLEGHRDVELVGDGDDDRVDVGVSEHGIIIAESFPGRVHSDHPLQEVIGHIADSVEFGVLRLPARLEVSRLRDRTRAQHSDPKRSLLFAHATRILLVGMCRTRTSEKSVQATFAESTLYEVG